MSDTQQHVQRLSLNNGSGGVDGSGTAEQEAAGTLSPAAALVEAVGELSDFSFQPAFEGGQDADHYELDDYEGVRRRPARVCGWAGLGNAST